MTLNNLAKDHLACILLHLYILYDKEHALNMHTKYETAITLSELGITDADYPRLTNMFAQNNQNFHQLVEKLSLLVKDKLDRQYCSKKIQLSIDGGLECNPPHRLKELLAVLLITVGETFYN